MEGGRQRTGKCEELMSEHEDTGRSEVGAMGAEAKKGNKRETEAGHGNTGRGRDEPPAR